MPAYNAGLYIYESIHSVLNQTLSDIELIVVDDGSTDDTVEIIQSFGNKVCYVAQQNKGAAAARNTGVMHAKGEWLAFLDSDDIWVPDKLEKQLQQCGNYEWSCTDIVFVGSGENVGKRASDIEITGCGFVLPKLVVSNFIATSSVMMKKAVFEEVGGFDVTLRALQDWDLWLRVAAKYELGYLHEPCVEYRVHKKSTSRSTRRTHQYHIEIIRRTFGPGGVGENMPSLRRKALAHSYGILDLISEDSGDYAFALACAFKSLFYEPLRGERWKAVIRAALYWLRSLFVRPSAS